MTEGFLLKIIGGPHSGAEVALDEGTLLIGTNDDCDLILSDTLVNDQHLKVSVNADKASLEVLANPTYLAGEEIPLGSTPLEPFQFVSLGTTHFVIGPLEGDWPPLSAADIPTLTKQPTEEELQALEEQNQDNNEDPQETPEESPSHTPDNTHLKSIATAGAMLALLIAITIGVLLFSDDQEEIDLEPEAVEDLIQTKLYEIDFHESISVQRRGERVIVDGYVEKNEDKALVESSLEPYMGEIEFEVYSQQFIEQSINDLLKVWKLPIQSEEIDLGKIQLKGYYGDYNAWNDRKDQIEDEVPGIIYLQDDVTTSRRVNLLSPKILKEHNFTDKVQVAPMLDHVLLKGILVEQDVPEFNKFIAHLRSKLGYEVPVKNAVTITQPENIYYQFEIDSVSIGAIGVLVTKEGERYYEGGVLPDGYVIESISRDGILLKKGKQTVTINIGDNNEQSVRIQK